MGGICAAKNCKNRTDSRKKFSFRFPSDSARARIWVLNCNREDLMDNLNTLYTSHKLCQDHFEERMFTNHKHNRLKVKAFPTLFPLTEESFEEDTESSYDLDHSYAALIDSSTELLKQNSENAPNPAHRNENNKDSGDECCIISINKPEVPHLKVEDEIDIAPQSETNNLGLHSVDKFFSEPAYETKVQTQDDFGPKCKREVPATENGLVEAVKIETDHNRTKDELLEHNYCGDLVEQPPSPELRNFASVGQGFNSPPVVPEEKPPSPKVKNCISVDHGANVLVNVEEQKTTPIKRNFHSIGRGKSSLIKTEKNMTLPELQNLLSVGHGINLLVLPEEKPPPLIALKRIPGGHGIQPLVRPEEIPQTVQKCIPLGQAMNSVLTPITAPKGWKFVTVGSGTNFVMNAEQPVRNYVSVGNGINLLVVPEENSPPPKLKKCIPVGYGIISPVNVQGINTGLKVRNSIVNPETKTSVRNFVSGVHGNSSVFNVKQQNTPLEVSNFVSGAHGNRLVVNIDRQTTPPEAQNIGSVGHGINLLVVSQEKIPPPKVKNSIPADHRINSPMNQECESTAPKVRKWNPEAVELEGIPPPPKIRSCNPVGPETHPPTKQEKKTTAPKVRNCPSVSDGSSSQVDQEKESSSRSKVRLSISSTQTTCGLSANSPRKQKLRELIKELNREKKFLKKRILQLERQLSER